MIEKLASEWGVVKISRDCRSANFAPKKLKNLLTKNEPTEPKRKRAG